jgi:hypothetical protein
MKPVHIPFLILIALILLIGAYFLFKPVILADKVTNTDNIITSYEEFYSLYESCKEVCFNLNVLEQTTEEVQGFSKAERILALQMRLSNLVKEYNAKSKMKTKNLWKADDLPYQIDVNNICN